MVFVVPYTIPYNSNDDDDDSNDITKSTKKYEEVPWRPRSLVVPFQMQGSRWYSVITQAMLLSFIHHLQGRPLLFRPTVPDNGGLSVCLSVSVCLSMSVYVCLSVSVRERETRESVTKGGKY